MVENTRNIQSQVNLKEICLFCQSTIEFDEPKSLCPSCNRVYHKECWEQNKGCAIFGCPNTPPTEPLNELEIPISYWGKEKKTCPTCRNEINAAALRCIHCGTIFSSPRPISIKEFHEEQQIKEQGDKLKRWSILFFIFNILTCTAPIGAIIGFFWFQAKKKALKSLSYTYTALVKIGLVVGIAQTLLIILFGVIDIIFKISIKRGQP